MAGPYKFKAFANGTEISGAINWQNPNNVEYNDNVAAVASNPPNPFVTQYLKATNPDTLTEIADDAVIIGVKVYVYRWRLAVTPPCDVTDNSVKLIIGGTITGPEKAKAGSWATSKETVEYDWNIVDLGGALTGAQVKTTNFGVGISASVGYQVLGGAGELDYVCVEFELQPEVVVLPSEGRLIDGSPFFGGVI